MSEFIGWPNEGVEYWNAFWRGKAAEGFFDDMPENQPPTRPLPQRLRAAAELIEEMNARDGVPLDTPIRPDWLRTEADGMEVNPA